MTITLTREEAQQVLDALKTVTLGVPDTWHGVVKASGAIETLRARLSAPEPKPACWLYKGEVRLSPSDLPPAETIALYTAPPQREWQGLTDEEKNEITWGKTVYEILDLAEAKLKEKNSA
jgi:hypothetical protein